jgi:hypothetical protein
MKDKQTANIRNNPNAIGQLPSAILIVMLVLAPGKAVMADSGGDEEAKFTAFEKEIANKKGVAKTLKTGEITRQQHLDKKVEASSATPQINPDDPQVEIAIKKGGVARAKRLGNQAGSDARRVRFAEPGAQDAVASPRVPARESASYDEFNREFTARSNPHAADTLNRGKQAQNDRYRRELENLDPETRALVEKKTQTAHELDERGRLAQHKRQHAKRMDDFEQRVPGTQPSSAVIESNPGRRLATPTPRTAVTVIPDTKTATPRAHTTAKRNPVSRSATPGMRTEKPGMGKLAKAKKFAGKGAVVGLAVDVATCGQAPDAVQGGEWAVDTMRNPEQAGQRTGKLVQGAGRLASNTARNVTSPKRLGKCAVNTVKSTGEAVVGVAEYGASRVRDPRLLVNDGVTVVKTAGKVTYAVGDGVVKTSVYTGKQLQKGAKAMKRAQNNTLHATGRAAHKAGCAVAGLIKKPKGCR